MAQIADAYVSIRPKVTGFAAALRKALAPIEVSYAVQVVPKLTGFRADLKAELAKVQDIKISPVKIEPDLRGFRRELQAKLREVAPVTGTVSIKVTPDITGFRAALRAKLRALRPVPVPVTLDPSGAIRIKVVEDRARVVGRRLGRAVSDGASAEFKGITDSITAAIVPRRLRAAIRGVIASFGTLAGGVAKTFAVMGAAVTVGLYKIADVGFSVFESLAKNAAKFSIDTGIRILGFADKFADVFSQMGTEVGKFLASVGRVAGPIGGFVGALGAVAAMGAILVSVMAAVQAGFAAVSIVVVPLVAAVYALAGAFASLGTVAAGSVALLPGMITTLGGAVAVLGLAWDKLNNQLQKSGEGPLHDIVERLKNAVYEVIGFDRLIKSFVSNTLPKFMTGIDQVAQAWGRLFGRLADLAASKVVVNAVRSAFVDMAAAVDQLSRLISPLADIFITLSTKAQPAVSFLLDRVIGLVEWFDRFIATMSRSGELAALFQTVGVALAQVLELVRPLTTMFFGLFSAATPGAIQLLNLITTVIQRWSDWINSDIGQAKLIEFFAITTRMASDFIPIIETIFDGFIRLAPVFGKAMSTVVPILTSFGSVLVEMLVRAAPGFIFFLEQISAIMSDQAVIGALVKLGESIGVLIASFATFDPAMVATFVKLLADLVVTFALLVYQSQPLIQGFLGIFAAASQFIPVATTLTGVVLALAGAFFQLSAQLAWSTDKVKLMMGPMAALVVDKIPAFKNALSGVGPKLDALSTQFDQAGLAGINFGNSIITGLGGAYNSGYWDALAGKVKTFTDIMNELAKAGQVQSSFSTENLKRTSAAWSQYTAGAAAATQTLTAKTNIANNLLKGVSSSFATGLNQSLDKTKATTAKTAAALQKLVPADLKGKAFDSAKELATYIAKGLVSGTKAVNAAVAKMLANKQIFKALTDLANKVKARDAVIAQLAAQQKRLEELLAEKTRFRDALAETLMGARDLANAFNFVPDPRDIADALRQSLAELRRFAANLQALTQKGYGKDLVAQLAAAGIQGGGAVAEALASSTPAQVAEINKLFNQIGATATASANKVAANLYDPGINTVKSYIAGLKNQQKALDAQIAKLMNDVVAKTKKILGIKSPSSVYVGFGRDTLAGFVLGLQGTYQGKTVAQWADDIIADPMYQVGQDAVNGLRDGMVSREQWLANEMNTIAGIIVRTIKTALGIKSPSTVFRALGEDTVAGYVQGLQSGQADVVAQMNNLGSIQPSFGATATFAANAGNQPAVGVRVYIGDKELTDIVRTEVVAEDVVAGRSLTYGSRARW